MIKTPIAPRVHEEMTHLMVRDFDCTPKQAAKLTTKLINSMRSVDLDIVKGEWMEIEKRGGPVTWATLAQGADELVKERNGIKPWNPPELQ